MIEQFQCDGHVADLMLPLVVQFADKGCGAPRRPQEYEHNLTAAGLDMSVQQVRTHSRRESVKGLCASTAFDSAFAITASEVRLQRQRKAIAAVGRGLNT